MNYSNCLENFATLHTYQELVSFFYLLFCIHLASFYLLMLVLYFPFPCILSLTCISTPLLMPIPPNSIPEQYIIRWQHHYLCYYVTYLHSSFSSDNSHPTRGMTGLKKGILLPDCPVVVGLVQQSKSTLHSKFGLNLNSPTQKIIHS